MKSLRDAVALVWYVALFCPADKKYHQMTTRISKSLTSSILSSYLTSIVPPPINFAIEMVFIYRCFYYSDR